MFTNSIAVASFLAFVAGPFAFGCQQPWTPVSEASPAGHTARTGERFVWTFDEDDATDFLSISGSWIIAHDRAARPPRVATV